MTHDPALNFRPIQPADKPRLLEIAAQIWEGHDYLPNIFDAWIADPDHCFEGMELAGQLVGCGGILAFDATRGWLEGLRIDPAMQKRGLGRVMVRHVLTVARERGFQNLSFSTYFKNAASIRTSESFGFRRVASYTNLEAEIGDLPTEETGAHEITTVPGLPPEPLLMWNDWLCVPPDVPARRFFPGAFTLRTGGSTCLLADNQKYATEGLDICSIQAPPTGCDPALVRRVIAEARSKGKRFLHMMLPVDENPAPFLDAGLKFHEQMEDVYLYSARTADLRL